MFYLINFVNNNVFLWLCLSILFGLPRAESEYLFADDCTCYQQCLWLYIYILITRYKFFTSWNRICTWLHLHFSSFFTTEPGSAGDIGAIEVWLIDLLIDSLSLPLFSSIVQVISLFCAQWFAVLLVESASSVMNGWDHDDATGTKLCVVQAQSVP